MNIFVATDLISQTIKAKTELGVKAKEILIKGEALPEYMVAQMIDQKVNSPECAHHGTHFCVEYYCFQLNLNNYQKCLGYVLDGFPTENDSNFDIGKQIEMLKNWKLQPDFIINLRVSFLLSRSRENFEY